jgi:FkbM family methyltransferase
MKLLTYARYFLDYLKHGDLGSIVASAKYIANKSSHSNDRIIRTSAGKFFCRKNTNDFQFANYYYEWGVKKFLLDRKNDFSVFIDGGACTGEYSIILSRYGIRCFAFEPIKNTYDVLRRNLELNGLDGKVKAFPFGLGDHTTVTDFVFNPVNTGASHIAGLNQTGDFKVEIRTFDSVYTSLGITKDDSIFFKLDVEGMEPEVLRGAEKFIREFPNITFVMEEKHSGGDTIKNTLNNIAAFEYGIVDEYNIYAKKTK